MTAISGESAPNTVASSTKPAETPDGVSPSAAVLPIVAINITTHAAHTAAALSQTRSRTTVEDPRKS